MLLVLSVILSITAVCKSDQPTIISRIDSNEIDNFLTFDHSIFPTIDPNIAEDTTLTTVVFYIYMLFFSIQEKLVLHIMTNCNSFSFHVSTCN